MGRTSPLGEKEKPCDSDTRMGTPDPMLQAIVNNPEVSLHLTLSRGWAASDYPHRESKVVQPVRCGYLWRTSAIWKKWQRRWYAFQSQTLSCAEVPEVSREAIDDL